MANGTDTQALGGTPPFVTPQDQSNQLPASPPTQDQAQATPPPPPPAAKPNPAQAASVADTAHHSMLGKAFRALMGNEVSYQVDPKTGKLVQTTTPEQPGQFFRSIVAGAMLGGAAASKNKATNFAEGFTEGGEAAIEGKQKQDLKKRAQAQEDFKNQQEAKRAGTEEDLRRAQIAMHNAQTMRENQLIQKEGFEAHEAVAARGRVQIQPYIDAGGSFIYRDVSETEVNQLLKDNPTAVHFLWEPTGTKIAIKDGKVLMFEPTGTKEVTKDGRIDYELTYSAIDPKGKIKVTDDNIKAWKEAELDKVYGQDFFKVLSKDKELPAEQYMSITEREQHLTNRANEKRKAKADVEKEEAGIKLTNAQAAHFKAESYKIYQDEAEKKEADAAFDILMKGGDLTKLTPKQRGLLIKGLNDSANSTEREIHDLPKDPVSGQPTDQDTAKKLYKDLDSYHDTLKKIQGIKDTETTQTSNVPPDKTRAERDGKVLYVPNKELDDFQRENPDAKIGKDVSVTPEKERSVAMNAARDGKTVKFGPIGPPTLKDLTAEEQLLTDGKGNYIIRPADFKNPQWKSLGVGTTKVEYPPAPASF